MRALLLAAGKGTRISRYLGEKPKCTVEIEKDLPLIKYTVQMLNSLGIEDIGIVTGYKHEVIEQVLEGLKIKFFFAPFYNVTNSIVSAWFAKDFFCNEDILIMNADVFIESKVLKCLFKERNNNNNITMLYDSSRKEEADYKFLCDNNISQIAIASCNS